MKPALISILHFSKNMSKQNARIISMLFKKVEFARDER